MRRHLRRITKLEHSKPTDRAKKNTRADQIADEPIQARDEPRLVGLISAAFEDSSP
jgi:hypothetical protein